MLARGVDVASDVEAVLGYVVAGQAAGDLLLGFQRPDAALADVVRRPDAGIGGKPEHIAAAVRPRSARCAWTAQCRLSGVLISTVS
jgi:hypothetical protein